MPRYYKKFVNIVSSKAFFWIVVLLFVIEATWFALSARYPMALNEAYHFQLIRIYSHNLDPFFSKQPAGALTYGPLVHSSSFLYHYLMSFPYRLISHFSDSLRTQVTILRLIDVALFTWAIFNFRKLLIKVRDEPALANLTILFFVFIPVVPFLAGQVSYDDLSILLISFVLLWTVRFVEQFRTKQQLNIPLLVGISSISLLASMVSYLFLPILVAVVIYLAYIVIRFAQAKPHNFKRAIKYSWLRIKPLKKLVIFLFLLISLGLFIDTYGYNLVKFHNPIPKCNQLLSVERCQTYPGWNQNYISAQTNINTVANPVSFTSSWTHNIYVGTFSVSNSPTEPNANASSKQQPFVNTVIITIFSLGILLFFVYGKKILRENPYLKFLLFVDLVFLVSVWITGYYHYWHLGQMDVINGRYLVPIIIPIIYAIGLCYKKFLVHHKRLLALMAVIVFICLLQIGGIISFINSSNSNWYWSNNKTINSINVDAQKIIRPITIN